MPSELEELVEFLHHGNTQIRQVAVEQLVGYSTPASNQFPLFKRNQLEPCRDLKMLIRDYTPIATNALTIITNLTSTNDMDILKCYTSDDKFLEDLLHEIIDTQTNSTADTCCGLLANLIKDDTLAARLMTFAREIPPPVELPASKSENRIIQVTSSRRVLDQLMDVFVKGANNSLNNHANFDYLSYVFADLSKHKFGREYLLERQEYDSVVPITKLVVFTEHGSLTRRKGIASTIKNCAFEVEKHEYFMAEEPEGVGLLPYIMLPLAGNEVFDDEDSEGMLDELQLLPPDKEREVDDDVVATHLETLLLLTTKREGREKLREVKVYPVIRELHLKRDAEGIDEGCVRLVNVIMRDEETGMVREDEERKIEEVF